MPSNPAAGSLYVSTDAASYLHDVSTDTSQVQRLHQALPEFKPTPLRPLPALAAEVGIKHLFVKDESSRLGLPAFKILGASWGVFRVIATRGGLPLESVTLEEVGAYARREGLELFTATDGNHGRAVARMGKVLGIRARVFVPFFTDAETRRKIESEGAEVVGVDGDYDATVAAVYAAAGKVEGGRGLFVQDTSFDGYEEIPRWIVEGYSTLLLEIEAQLAKLGLKADVVVTPIGVGSLGHAVVMHCKSNSRGIKVLAIEPETSACLYASLKAGEMRTIKTGSTIMDGMNCGTVSPISWPVLRAGVDASVTISDWQSHQAVRALHMYGVRAGPCGAGTWRG